MPPSLLRYQPVLLEGAIFLLTFLVLIGLGRWLRRHQGVQLGLPYFLFALAFSTWVPHVITAQPFLPWLPGGLSPATRASLLVHADRWVCAVTLLLGTFFALALVRRYFWESWFARTYKVPAPKFLTQLGSLLVVLAAVMVTLTGIFKNDISGLAFSSTIVVGVVGLAMQDLLGNIIAGVALELGKPFRVGDWLVVDGKHAEVIEVNWRSTRLRMVDDVHLDIPNKHIVGTTITNLSFPTPAHALRFNVGFEYDAPPNFVKDVLQRAAVNAPGVLPVPAPQIYLKDFGDSAVIYEVRFWMQDEAHFSAIHDAIRTNIWYEAQRSGLRIPFPIRTLQIERTKATKHQDSLAAARTSARQHPFLQLLEEAQVERLLAHAQLLRFGRGEIVIRQGAAGQSMFILLSGAADVFVDANGSPAHVASLRTGDYFGEMSLLTGAPRSATVRAREDCEMWEIEKHIMAEFLTENATLAQRLSELLAQRQMETEGIRASSTGPVQVTARKDEYAAGFLQKLSAFFGL